MLENPDISLNPESQVLIIGAAAIDMVGRIKSDLNAGSTTPAIIRRSHGGVARNVAENLARYVCSVSLISAVGNDPEGDQIIKTLDRLGVNTKCIIRRQQYSTATYLAILGSDGRQVAAIADMGVIQSISPEDIQTFKDQVMDADIIFVDANLSANTLETIFELANARNVPICADATSTALAMRLYPYLSEIMILTTNVYEATHLTDMYPRTISEDDAVAATRKLISEGVGFVITAMGRSGVFYGSSDVVGHVPVINTEIVDPTGAGDAMTAAVLFGMMNDIDFDESVRLGVSAASLTLKHLGSVVPDLSIEKLYDQLSL